MIFFFFFFYKSALFLLSLTWSSFKNAWGTPRTPLWNSLSRWVWCSFISLPEEGAVITPRTIQVNCTSYWNHVIPGSFCCLKYTHIVIIIIVITLQGESAFPKTSDEIHQKKCVQLSVKENRWWLPFLPVEDCNNWYNLIILFKTPLFFLILLSSQWFILIGSVY